MEKINSSEPYNRYDEAVTIGKTNLKINCLDINNEKYVVVSNETNVIMMRLYAYALSMQVNNKSPYYFLDLPENITLEYLWNDKWFKFDVFEPISKRLDLSMMSSQEDPTLKFPLIIQGIVGKNEKIYVVHYDIWLFLTFLRNPYFKDEIIEKLIYKPTKKIIKPEEVRGVIKALEQILV